jgi:hypothetical protein
VITHKNSEKLSLSLERSATSLSLSHARARGFLETKTVFLSLGERVFFIFVSRYKNHAPSFFFYSLCSRIDVARAGARGVFAFQLSPLEEEEVNIIGDDIKNTSY